MQELFGIGSCASLMVIKFPSLKIILFELNKIIINDKIIFLLFKEQGLAKA